MIVSCRELEEETGIKSNELMSFTVLAGPPACPNLFHDANGTLEIHTVTIFVGGKLTSDSSYNYPSLPPNPIEPDKCHEFRWAQWDDLPRPLFPALKQLSECWVPI